MSGLKNRHARATLALFTSARALHLKASPAAVARAAGVTRSDVVNAMKNTGVSFEAAEKLFFWNGLDLTRVLASAPGRRGGAGKSGGMGKTGHGPEGGLSSALAKGIRP